MFKRLEEILSRYDALSEKLSDPAVVADTGAFKALSKEQAELRDTAEKYREYLRCEKEMKDAFAQAEAESEKEMKALFSDEGHACRERLEKLKEELELLVVDISDFSSDDRTLGVVKYEWKNAGPKR